MYFVGDEFGVGVCAVHVVEEKSGDADTAIAFKSFKSFDHSANAEFVQIVQDVLSFGFAELVQGAQWKCSRRSNRERH